MNNIKKRESSFTQVSNTILRDSNISFKAKGLFCYMFSMDESWNFTLQSIATQQNDGLSSVTSAMNELKEYGYVVYEKLSSGRGIYNLNDDPKLENPNMENPNMDFTIVGKSDPIKNTNSTKNKNIRIKIDKKKNIKKEIDTEVITEKPLEERTIDYLNKLTGKNFTYTKGNLKEIKSQIKKGATQEQLKYVIDVKVNEWINNDEMKKHLNPVTLFRDSNFERYLNQDFQLKGAVLDEYIRQRCEENING